jgi:DNA-binding IclR family transcriptional regulator
MANDVAPEAQRERPVRSTTLAKAAHLLRIVAERFPTGGTLSAIAREVGMNTATSHRLLGALSDEGLLSFDPYAKTYHVGFQLLEIAESAQAVAPDLRLRHRLRPLLTRIAARTEESTYLSIRSRLDAFCIDRVEGTYPISANTLTAGSRRPLGISAGSVALLATLPEEEAERVIAENARRFERYSGISAAEVSTALAHCLRDGYAFNDGRIIPEVAAVAVAFRLPGTNQPVVAISVASGRSRMRPRRRRAVVGIIRSEIAQIGAGNLA